MNKDYGPKGFEKAWAKALTGFNETKIFFTHNKSQTIVNYIKGNKLVGVEMYRSQFEIDRWLGHFQEYLNTGVFDTDAYWVQNRSVLDGAGNSYNVIITDPEPVAMKLVSKLWNVHSPAFNKFMKDERAAKGDLGFTLVSRP